MFRMTSREVFGVRMSNCLMRWFGFCGIPLSILFGGSLAVKAQPVNDAFTNRIPLTGYSTNISASNVNATKETGEPDRVDGVRYGATVWWSWTAPASGTAQIHTFGSSFDTVLGVYTGTLGSFTTIAENNNAPGGGNQSLVTFQATAGTTYVILVGGTRISPGVFYTGTIQLNVGMPPTVSLTSPTNGAVLPASEPVTVAATGSTPAPAIQRIDFYSGAKLLGTDTNAPYSITTTNLPMGSNNLYAILTDSAGQTATSSVVNVTVLSPGANITSPQDGAVFTNTNPITVYGMAMASGTITNVSFWVDGQLFGVFGISQSSTWSATWSNVTSGTHRFLMTAMDNTGLSYTSAPVMIAVAQTIIASNSVWKYLDNGSDQGTAWIQPSFDDSGWASGPGTLGYGDTNRQNTILSYGPDPNNKYITTYFRRAFAVTNAGSYSNLILRVLRDDGAVVYLNGVEVGRFNVPAGPVNYLTTVPNAADDGNDFFPTNVSASLLVEGTNVLAVEIHQDSGTSSDISFDLELLGIPKIIRNLSPSINLASPTNSQSLIAPGELTISASASDADGSVARVDFYADSVKLGSVTNTPFSFTWTNPPVGRHEIYAVAVDDQGAATASTVITVYIFDESVSPLVQITTPTNGTVISGLSSYTNLPITATAFAMGSITNVEFWANGNKIGQASTSPYTMIWSNAAFGTNQLLATASDDQGRRGTSTVVTVVIVEPPINTNPPVIANVIPARGATITSLSNILITFSENVVGVDAADLLVNGKPATAVTGSGSNYTFTAVQTTFGLVTVTWASNHGITDIGYPTSLPFDAQAPGASWTYNIADLVPPTIASVNPPAGATLTNLTQINVVFSENVAGVDAADLLINGSPAISLAGGGSNYMFYFPQPASGTISISWAAGHGITDLAVPPNSFNATGAGATWTYTLDARTILVQSNSMWRFVKGTSEASNPIDAWRQLGFDDSNWTLSPAPFFYGDTGYTNAQNPGTYLGDMMNTYSTIYLRIPFQVANPAAITNLLMRAVCDDGFIAWINGREVVRYNVNPGDNPYNAFAISAVNEPNNNGAAWSNYALPTPVDYLVAGTNILAVHVLNATLNSSDLGFDAQLYTYMADPTVLPPQLLAVIPAAGSVYALTNITVTFTEPVGGVKASDLLINGAPATSVSGGPSNAVYTFSFTQPPYGLVQITWASNIAITDFDPVPKSFNGNAPGATWQYVLINPNAPVVASQIPSAGASVTQLTSVTISFSKPVTGVDAADLLINGVPATNISGSGANYTFSFPQPAYGTVSIGWTANPGIVDLAQPPNSFNPAQAGNYWSYTLIDLLPPVIVGQIPAAGAFVTNLTQITVIFSEPVQGVDASDLLINGAPASSVTGSGTTYTFTFQQPNATIINVSWAVGHGIRDLAPTPNSFNSSSPQATWVYYTPDTVPPRVAQVTPMPGITLKSLNSIIITFTEPVVGVTPDDLVINNQIARSVTGSGEGPYVFQFSQPAAGTVEVRWRQGNDIRDLATPPNPLDGSEWTYQLDPNATFAGKILINEIMFNPLGGRPADEWIELFNSSTGLVNLTGWKFTRGVSFTFPNVSLPAGGYLVVAADVAAFRSKYPNVSNVIGGWTGQLANSDETIELTSATGETVNRVHYATEGDWARRERGCGARLVTSITRSGSTATVTIFDHRYTSSDQVLISGADQPEYNGRFTLSGITPSTFNITVSGSPASPATGTIICRQIIDNGQSGWSWFCPADGMGSSLELINPALPNTTGQNWSSSSTKGGTPGQPNSVASSNVAPLILDATHFPPVPRSTDPVTITARVRDELSNGVQSVTLFYRNHTANYGSSPPPFNSTPMLDDGAHNDGLASDGLYGAVLPAAANGTVIEFYIQATDTNGLSRTWPAPTWDTNNTFGQLANALYQVDDEAITNRMPVVRVVMTGTERAIFPPSDRNGNAEMNVTMVSADGEGTDVRYLCGLRVRGAGTRSRTPTNNRLNIPCDNRWKNQRALNLNCQFVHCSVVGNVLAQKSGLPATDAHVIQYRINGVNPAPLTAPVNGSSSGAGWGIYLMLKPVAGDLLADLYPEDSGGNVYRASTGNHNANLTYYDNNPSTYLSHGYFKTSNQTENDWTDLINLCYAFSQVTDNASYTEAIRTNLNVQMWMRYFAVGSLMNFTETAMFNGIGDDYALYRGQIDRRFIVIGHDFDTIFGQGDTLSTYPALTNSSIFIMLNPPNSGANMPVLQRFMTNEAFAPLFYAELKRLCDTTFSPSQLNPLFDQLLTGWGVGPDATLLANMKTFAANRRAIVLSQIPLDLTINHGLSQQNGYPYTTTPNVTLYGTTHAVDTRRVLVNGLPASWSAWEARWTNTVTLLPGINRVLVQSLNSNNVEFARATVDIWYDDGSVQTVSGTVSADTTWTAANGPYQVSGTLTINSGVTLTIQAGTTVYFANGASLVVANGGRLLAEGTDSARIRFTRPPGTTNTWGGITINGGANSPETRISYAHFEFNNSTAIHSANGTVWLDHLTFGNTAVPYVSLDGSSFVVSDCHFPTATAAFEGVHGTGGIKTGGRGIFLRNFFGAVNGYNDAVDFTGGNRPGPIVQFINNVFMGSGDDILDLDGTDAWVEGNIFLHVHKNGSPDSSSAISGGLYGSSRSEVTAIGNIFYDCDHAATAKEGNFYVLINNTIVHQTKTGGTDTDAAVVNVSDAGTAEGAGFYLEGNIIYDAEKLARAYTNALITFTNNLLPMPWNGPGGGNSTEPPLLKYIPQLSETQFTNWASAQVMWDWFSLQPGSPARNAGPNGADLGGVIPMGATISGEPAGETSRDTVVLTVGPLRTGDGIQTNGWPNGAGYTHYQWRLDGGQWSAETPVSNPIVLYNLPDGPHRVEVIGRRDSGLYQNDPLLGSDARITASRTWTVNTAKIALRINEVLAANSGVVMNGTATPDLIELYNDTGAELDLAGIRLTDDPQNPDRFIFPAGASIPANGYLVLFADDPDGSPGYHLGFKLNQTGDAVYLYDKPERGGILLDTIAFGPQIPNLSIGRMPDGSWALAIPTFGAPNKPANTGDPRQLRINEWLALGQMPFDQDFIEIYNADTNPVNMGGLYLSDTILSWPNRHQIAPLTFIPGRGYLRFIADGDAKQGPEHLNFKLSPQQGGIGLYDTNLQPIDLVMYQPQWLNISQGRSPNGGSNIVYFDVPTPGAPNPISQVNPNGGALVINEILAHNTGLVENGSKPDWVELYNGTTNTISLADMSLTDDLQQMRRFVFPAGTTIAPGAFLRVLFDKNQPPGPNNTGFGLKSTGGSVYLFDTPANGTNLIGAITYGLQAANFSIGRVPDGSANWVLTSPTPDAPNAAIPSLAPATSLKINEWMAAPASGDDWFEIYNTSPLPVAIGGLWLSDNLNNRQKHQIPPLSFIGVGTNAYQKFIADGNTAAGANHVSFSLKASGEALGLYTATGSILDEIEFGPQLAGVSQGRFPDAASNIVSFPGTESPGAPNYLWLTNVAINEALTHSEPPLEDAIELVNLTDTPVDIGGWWLSDDPGTIEKYQIPAGTIIPAHGYWVVYEAQFNNPNLASIPFALSSQGDEVVLSAATNGTLTGYRTHVKFGPALNGVSFGRYVNSIGEPQFVAMSARSFGSDDPGSVEEFRLGTGAPNPYPLVGPVVISEIMYHPQDIGTNDNTRDEFIELRNITGVPVPLYDPAFPTNTWHLRDAVDFEFPPGTVMQPYDYLLVVSFDPINNPTALAQFKAAYHITAEVPIVGPYRGKLANSSDEIELRRPDTPDTNGVPYVLVERVKYSDSAPWPSAADGTGMSLQRVDNSLFGNDPANWFAAPPTPGPQAAILDFDQDGMPDIWEMANGLDPLNPLDATLDSDNDGMNNLQEYLAGTSPFDPQSVLRLEKPVAPVNGSIILKFTALADHSYAIESQTSLGAGWETIYSLPAASTNRLIILPFPMTNATHRFYRIRTP